MTVISEERFNQDIIDVIGLDLYSCDEYYTDGSLIVDSRCVNIKNCSKVRELDEKQKEVVYKHISPEVLSEVVKDENQIQKWWTYPLDRSYLYSTENRDVVLSEVYRNIFSECYPIYVYKDMFYFFLDLPKTEIDEADEIMFVGCCMRMATFEQQIKNMKAVNEFIENLPKVDKSKDKYI